MSIQVQQTPAVIQTQPAQNAQSNKPPQDKKTTQPNNSMGLDAWELTKATAAGTGASILSMGMMGALSMGLPYGTSVVDKAFVLSKPNVLANSNTAQMIGIVAPAIAGGVASQMFTDNPREGAMAGGVVGAGVGALAFGLIMRNVHAIKIGALVGLAGGMAGGAVAQK